MHYPCHFDILREDAIGEYATHRSHCYVTIVVFMWHHIKPILQVITLATAMLVSARRSLVLVGWLCFCFCFFFCQSEPWATSTSHSSFLPWLVLPPSQHSSYLGLVVCHRLGRVRGTWALSWSASLIPTALTSVDIQRLVVGGWGVSPYLRCGWQLG